MTMPFPTKPPAPLEAGEFRFPASEGFTLKNGMGLTVIENRKLPLVGIQLGIISGLTRAEHEKPGITAVAADMLCKGTAKRSAEEIAEEIDFLGTDIKAAGVKDYSLLSAGVLSDFIDEGLELMADIVINPTFPENELEKIVRLELASLANKRTQPVYQAKKVYFCCANCRQEFLKNPDQYLGALPQFATDPGYNQERHEHNDSAGLHWLIKPAGITTLSFLLATLALGLNVHRNRKVLLPLHRRLGIATVCLALLHLLLILLS